MVKKILDLATSLAVLSVCVLILAEAVQTYRAPAAAVIAAAPVEPARPKPGDSLASISAVDFTQSPRTLVMAIQSSCHFCSDSMRFYQELSRQKSRAVRLVVVAPESTDSAKAYVTSKGFTPDGIAESDFGALHVGGTPTLMLTNAKGVIERVWLGKLTAAKEKEVLAAVTGTTGAQ